MSYSLKVNVNPNDMWFIRHKLNEMNMNWDEVSSNELHISLNNFDLNPIYDFLYDYAQTWYLKVN